MERLPRKSIAASVGILLLLVSIHVLPVSAESVPPAVPGTGGLQPCAAPTPQELVNDGTNARREPVFLRKESAMRAHCRTLRQMVIERVLGNRIDFCGGPGSNAKLRETLSRKMQLPQGTEDESVGDGFLFNEGCTPHDCAIKAFVLMDATGAHGVVGLIDCERSADKVSPHTRILYLFSDFPNSGAIPESVRQRIEIWRAAVEREERDSCRCTQARVEERFLR